MGRIQRKSFAVLDKDLKASEELPGRREGLYLGVWRKHIPSRGNTKCKVPEAVSE